MVYIVGGGVFGQVNAAKLRSDGHCVTVIDRRESEAGSLPSGGHLKPSWLTMIPRRDLDKSMETLDHLFGMETLTCLTGIGPLTKKVELLRVDIEKILSNPTLQANVTRVGNGYLEYTEYTEGQKRSHCRLEGVIIVAAGVWCKQLLPRTCKNLFAKKGISFIFTGGASGDESATPNLIRIWAPYKQIVRTTHGPNRTWIGDGTALLPQNWSDRVEDKIYARIQSYAPRDFTALVRRRGLRPYLSDSHHDDLGVVRQIDTHLWVATGGAKSGTALAGVAANQISEALQ